MTRFHQYYNQHTDVLTVRLRDAEYSVADDTPEGFIVHYADPSGEIVAVTVPMYCQRFGSGRRTLHIDTPQPLDIPVRAVTP